ncbi:MAG: NAD-dependent deacylase [Epsilonproteobacteria bacterium]|nr:NAD-dependent deacylase [Campylobacterota bacterium]
MKTFVTAARWIAEAGRIVAFTGAGISVESGIPTFRGEGGLWSRYDPKVLELGYFYEEPEAAWRVIKELFYDTLTKAPAPNAAHRLLAELERAGKLIGVITQNIDGLHQKAGSRNVIEFHGTAKRLVCLACRKKVAFLSEMLEVLPPRCGCGGVLKPDFIFFGEGIGPENYQKSVAWLNEADLLLIVGTTGEVMPASMLPFEAKKARVIEINPEPTRYSEEKTDLFLQAKAGEAALALAKRLLLKL